MTSREGKLTVEGDRAALLFERRLPYPVEAVWAAITDPSQRNQWMGKPRSTPAKAARSR